MSTSTSEENVKYMKSFYADCVSVINKLRDQENKELLERYEDAEAQADSDAKKNYENGPHYQQSGHGQNECGLQYSIEEIFDECMERQMYKEEKECYKRHLEGDPKACKSLKDKDDCECQYGHYQNMIENPFKKVACGIYETPDGQYKAVMNFYY